MVAVLGALTFPTSEAIAQGSPVVSSHPGRVGLRLESARALGLCPSCTRLALAEGDSGVHRVKGTLGELVRLAEKGRVELAAVLHAHGAEDMEVVGVPVTALGRLALGASGQGVLVGVVDTGIDWSHPDFLDGQGRTRVRWLLDLGLDPRPGVHPGVDSHGGALWSAQEIDEARVGAIPPPSSDSAGHGTFVAAIAAGRDPQHGEAGDAGVAPASELIVVKASHGDSFGFDEATVLEGVDFILERAEALGRPVVVNLSLGGHVGPHDGRSLFELGLRQRFAERPGRALVVSAGNAGASDMHASGVLAQTGLVTLSVEVPEDVSPSGGAALVEIWYRHSVSPVDVGVVAPSGDRLSGVGGGQTATKFIPNLGTVALSHTLPRPDGLQGILITLQALDSAPMEPGTYLIELDGGRGRFDAWLADDGGFGARLHDHLDPDIRLGVPCAMEGAICVGAYTSRGRWSSLSGVEAFEVIVGTPSYFSGTGPTYDGRPKPDLLAPGLFVASAMAREADPHHNPRSVFALLVGQDLDPVLEDGAHAISQGTSAAAPFVTGAAALLFEQDPSRTGRELRDLLRASTARPALASTRLWHPRAGFGLLDVSMALETGSAQPSSSAPSPSRSDAGLTRDLLPLDGAEVSTLFIQVRDDRGAPLDLANGRLTISSTCPRGRLALGTIEEEGPWLRRASVAVGDGRGVCSLGIDVDGLPLEVRPTLSVADSRTELGLPRAAVRGGGCQQVRGGTGPWPWWLAVVALALRLRGRGTS